VSHGQADESSAGIVIEHRSALSGKPGCENEPAAAGLDRRGHAAQELIGGNAFPAGLVGFGLAESVSEPHERAASGRSSPTTSVHG
jgi:hypothetical protein